MELGVEKHYYYFYYTIRILCVLTNIVQPFYYDVYNTHTAARQTSDGNMVDDNIIIVIITTGIG